MRSIGKPCLFVLLLALPTVLVPAGTEEPFDVVLAGGRVIDPETGLDAVRDVGIRNGKIVAIAEEQLDSGGLRIEAEGLVVAPGFIDLHAHGQSDTAIRYRVRDGVTTALELEGGFSRIADWLASRAGRMRIHYGASVSHGELRPLAMPDLQEAIRAAEPQLAAAAVADEPLMAYDKIELFAVARNASLPEGARDDLDRLLDRGLREGGLGFGVAHQYYPGATRREIFDVFRLAARRQAPIFTHVRAMGIDAMQEVIADAAATGAPLHIVHVNSMALNQTPEILALIDGARRRGLDVTVEAYPYTAASTTIDSAIFDEGWQEKLEISYGDLQWQATGERLTQENFESFYEQGGVVIIHMMKEPMIELAIGTPFVMIASDAMPYDPLAHPRSAGTFARVLGRYVRERETLDLVTALRKMTLMPAQRLEKIAPAMKHKGRVQLGADADLVLFDPATVTDNATFENGLDYSTGIEHVLVSGTPVVRDGEIVEDVFPGRPVLGRYHEGPDAEPLAERFGRLCDATTEWMEAYGVPGAAVGLTVKGKTFTCAHGVTNADHPLDVTDETLFQIGSITKTFTGTLLAQLAEQGRVDLDATVRTYLPEFRVADADASARATVRDLLTHVGGWAGDNFGSTGPGDEALDLKVREMATLPQIAPLGAVYSYNNASFVVAGRVIEVVTGKTYEQALKEMLLEPLGLTQCFIEPGDVMTHRYAVGHAPSPSGAQVLRPWPLYRAANSVGALTCSVRNMLRYAEFHLGDGTTSDGESVLSAAALEAMHAPVFTKHGTDDQMALTWHLTDEGGVRQVAHGGGTLGQVSMLMLVPEHELGLSVLTNSGGGGLLTRDAVRWVLREYLDAVVTDPESIVTDADELQAYVGTYSRPFMDVELRVDDDGQRLVGTAIQKRGFPERDSPVGPPMTATLARYAPDRFVITDGPRQGSRIEIIRNEDGSIGWLRIGGRIHARNP
jgi:dihydroorotase